MALARRQDHPVDVQTYPPASELHSHENCQWIYRAASVFTLSPANQHLFGVNFDCRRYNVSEKDPRRWIDIGFEHPPTPESSEGVYHTGHTYSLLNIPGARRTLGARHPTQWNHWAHQLFPQHYHFNPLEVDNPTAANGGLIGTLPSLLAMVAFSCPKTWLEYVLQNHIRPRQWVPLPQNTPHGREYYPYFVVILTNRHKGTFERGVVVTVWIDPAGDPNEDEIEERREALEELEKGTDGPVFCAMNSF